MIINPSILKERPFQSLIKEYLIDENGYIEGKNKDYNWALAIDKNQLFTFLQDTQPKQIDKLKEIYKDSFESKFLLRLDSEIKRRGIIDVIKKGIKDYGQDIKLAYFKPATDFNKELVEFYHKNRLSVTEELVYKEDGRIDLVIFLNGLPIIAFELKNPFSGQNYKNAIHQFMTDRSPKELLFKFKQRVIVCFAMDTDECYMTTKLNNEGTYFLPFNKGNNKGKGNPVADGKLKTHYIWEDILKKDSVLEILEKFVYLKVDEEEDDKGNIKKKETMIFPRYHQLDVVKKILDDVILNGPGHSYLIQHSAGSGKTNSISWLAYRLSSLHRENGSIVFDGVIVITDRNVLDKQLQDNILKIDHKTGVVAQIDEDSKQLSEALNKGAKIIITTIQKFPFILDKVNDLRDRNYAIIIDEAHSSTTGKNIDALTYSLSLEEAERLDEEAEKNEKDTEDKILEDIERVGIQKNISFFAFTATPKPSTSIKFGRKNKNGRPEPFHLYSMKQAIEEGFILDVLKNYTTYKRYYKIAKTIQDDPIFDKAKATKAITQYIELHPTNIDQKTEIMVEHFRKITKKKIGGSAKAMVITGSRLAAVRYKIAFDEYIRKKGYEDLKALVAFSGTVKDSTEEYTESKMNGFAEKQLPKKFDTEEYQVLLVAEKYQTGFDQPKLHTMFVDKKLRGVKTVQTLSRLNRTCPGKDDTFVLDFVNDAEDIRKAFEPYYEVTEVEGDLDPNVLYTLSDSIYEYQMISVYDVEAFTEVFYKNKHTKKDMQLMNSYIDNAVEKIKGLERHDKLEIKNKIKRFINIYGFVIQVTPFEDVALHRLNIYLRYLVKKIDIDSPPNVDLANKISLEFYSIKKKEEAHISLGQSSDEDKKLDFNLSALGEVKDPESDTLSDIIKRLNEKYGTNFSENEKLALAQIVKVVHDDEMLKKQAQNNTEEDYEIAFGKKFEDMAAQSYEKNIDFYGKILSDMDFQKTVLKLLSMMTYNDFRR